MRVLIVKTSSLGDLVHTLPALTDACAARPDLRFDWLCEKSFAEIPYWHPAVERVIPCELRRWRKHLWQTIRSGEWATFKSQLRAQHYDLVLDAQGLVKSAFLATRAEGLVVGADFGSAREPLAALGYQRRIALPPRRSLHAIERTRHLFAQALDYPLPVTAPAFGLSPQRFPPTQRPRPYVVFLHATTWPTKCWDEASWQVLGHWCRERELDVLLPWGNDAERQAAERIAAPFGGTVLPRMGLTELAGLLAHARAVIGVDTGLAHVAAAVETPSITLYGPTLPGLTGTVGAQQIHLCSTDATTVDRQRPTTVAVTRVQKALAPFIPSRFSNPLE